MIEGAPPTVWIPTIQKDLNHSPGGDFLIHSFIINTNPEILKVTLMPA